MSGVASKFVSTSYTARFLKPFKEINRKIHEALGKVEPGGNVPKVSPEPEPAAVYKDINSDTPGKPSF